MRIVQVLWVDSFSDNAWRTMEEAIKDSEKEHSIPCRSVGYLLQDHFEYVLLASGYSPGLSGDDKATVMNTTLIPRCAIVEITDLAEDEEIETP